jgi:hypothetical protein
MRDDCTPATRLTIYFGRQPTASGNSGITSASSTSCSRTRRMAFSNNSPIAPIQMVSLMVAMLEKPPAKRKGLYVMF